MDFLVFLLVVAGVTAFLYFKKPDVFASIVATVSAAFAAVTSVFKKK